MVALVETVRQANLPISRHCQSGDVKRKPAWAAGTSMPYCFHRIREATGKKRAIQLSNRIGRCGDFDIFGGANEILSKRFPGKYGEYFVWLR